MNRSSYGFIAPICAIIALMVVGCASAPQTQSSEASDEASLPVKAEETKTDDSTRATSNEEIDLGLEGNGTGNVVIESDEAGDDATGDDATGDDATGEDTTGEDTTGDDAVESQTDPNVSSETDDSTDESKDEDADESDGDDDKDGDEKKESGSDEGTAPDDAEAEDGSSTLEL